MKCARADLAGILRSASQSSYNDSSWRQTVFSQSAALMSLLCPSVQSEGWLSLVCFGDHSTIRAKPSLPVTYLLSVNGTCCHACQPGQCITCWNQCCQTFVLLPESSLSFFCENACANYWSTGGNENISGCSIQGVFVFVGCLHALKIRGMQISTRREQSVAEFSLFQLLCFRLTVISR